MLSRPVLHFYRESTKYCEGYSSYRADTKSNKIQEGEKKTPKVRKPELSFLYAHFVTSCSTFLQSKSKNIQRVLDLQSEHKNKLKRKKGR